MEEKCAVSNKCTPLCSGYKERGQCPAWYQAEKKKKWDRKRKDEFRYTRKSSSSS